MVPEADSLQRSGGERATAPPPPEPRPTGKSLDDLAIGMTAPLTRTYSEWDILTFAAVTGDINPAHLDEAFAQESILRGKVAHGLLTASLISAVLGMRLPGPGTIYLSQDLKFRRPVRIGDTITTDQCPNPAPAARLPRVDTDPFAWDSTASQRDSHWASAGG